MDNVFVLREKNDNATIVEKLIDEIKSTTITLENYKKWDEKISNTKDIVLAQIEYLKGEFVDRKKRAGEMSQEDHVKKAREEHIVPEELYKLVYEMYYFSAQIVSWHAYQNELSNLLLGKLRLVFQGLDAMNLKREVLRESKELLDKQMQLHREISQKQSDMFLEVMAHQHKVFDENFISYMKHAQNEYKNERKESQLFMKNLLDENSRMNIQAITELTRNGALSKNQETTIVSKVSNARDTLMRDIDNEKPVDDVTTKLPSDDFHQRIKAKLAESKKVQAVAQTKNVEKEIKEKDADEFDFDEEVD